MLLYSRRKTWPNTVKKKSITSAKLERGRNYENVRSERFLWGRTARKKQGSRTKNLYNVIRNPISAILFTISAFDALDISRCTYFFLAFQSSDPFYRKLCDKEQYYRWSVHCYIFIFDDVFRSSEDLPEHLFVYYEY